MIDFSADHFALFGLPRNFRIDSFELDRRWRSLQADVHPDRHASGDDASRRMALQASSRVNEAYAILCDPAARGEYLLRLLGIESLSETDTSMPADFLIEQMERRESIEEASDAGDHTALELALAEIDIERRVLTAGLADFLDAQATDDAKTSVRKLRFLDRVKSEINDSLIAIEA